MPLYQVVILALVQAVTEFLPISSTAHLALIPWALKWQMGSPQMELVFDVALHVGTFLAVLAYFWRLWVRVIFAGFGLRPPLAPAQGREHAGPDDAVADRRMLWLLLLGTIPAAAAGVLLKDYVETSFRSPYVMAVSLIVVALVMAYGDRLATHLRGLQDTGAGDALAIGAAQAIALVPGVSRSGITITAGLLRNFRRDSAARFSFLLGTPAVAGAALVEGRHLLKHGLPPDMRLPFLLGILVSAAAGYVVIAFLIRYLQTHTLKVFIYYRVALGLIILALAIFSSAP